MAVDMFVFFLCVFFLPFELIFIQLYVIFYVSFYNDTYSVEGAELGQRHKQWTEVLSSEPRASIFHNFLVLFLFFIFWGTTFFCLKLIENSMLKYKVSFNSLFDCYLFFVNSCCDDNVININLLV